MYNETKLAVKRAFEIGKIVFGLGPAKYNKLITAVSKVKFPTDKELKGYLAEGLCLEDAKGLELKKRYEQAAVEAGFTKKEGFAMLKYAAMLKEIEDE